MPTRKPPEVSIVIVSWNSEAYLPRCLAALQAQTFRSFEVILIDNDSADSSATGVASRYPNLNITTERLSANLGFAAASNIGARLARGPWLALLNPDAFPRPDWLEQHMLVARGTPGAFFASRQIQDARPHLLDGEGDIYYCSGLALRRNYNIPHFAPGPPREVFSACAAAALYPREEFLAAGGFDEDYFAYHEDADLGFRLRLRGLRCLLVPAAVVHHVGGASGGFRSPFAIYHGHRNLVWTYAKDMPAPWVWLYLPLHLLVNLLSIPYFLLAGHGLSILRAKVDALRGLGRALRKRPLIQAQRRVPAAEVIRMMDRSPFGPLEGWVSRQWPDTP